MADYKNAKVHATKLEECIILDDVSQDGSINPRACLSETYIDDYEENIIDYLRGGQDFNEVWGQRPQVVETDEEGKYLLTSGYHTITALKNVVRMVQEEPDKEVHKTRMGDIDIDFEVILQVKKVSKSIDYKDAARFHASFSNVHGQPLTLGEKAKAAHNALSVMNLTKEENDDSLFPYKTERELASLLGVGKGTIHRVKKEVAQERHGVVAASQPTPADSTTSEPAKESKPSDEKVSDAVSEVANLEAQAQADAQADIAKENGVSYSEGDDSGEATENTEPADGDDTDDKPVLETKGSKDDGVQSDNRDKGVENLNLGLTNEDDPDADAKADAEKAKELKGKIVDMISKGSTVQLNTLVATRESLDFTLDTDANQLAKAYSAVGLQIKTARQSYGKLAADKDPDYNGAVDRVFGFIQKALEILGDENDERP